VRAWRSPLRRRGRLAACGLALYPGLVHRRYPSIATAITAIIAQACGLVASSHVTEEHSQAAGTTGQTTGGTSPGGASSIGGASIIGVSGSVSLGGALSTDCPSEPLFVDQVVSRVGAQRIFYSWTNEEQVAELRAGGELFSRSERPGLGRGLLFTELAAVAESEPSPVTQLAEALVNQVFAKARFAWTNPWATLLGFPGETYGNQLLRIELKPDAWIARFDQGTLTVFNANSEEVPIETALATPERIGAIFYQSRADAESCYVGSFARGGVGFREFALGNIDMVERWSLATPEIVERLQSDIDELQAFQAQVACMSIGADWSTEVTCAWGGGLISAASALGNYDFALGLPSDLYRPSSENLEALVAALEVSMPTGEPLVVTPGE
jgi:hypothetical protein